MNICEKIHSLNTGILIDLPYFMPFAISPVDRDSLLLITQQPTAGVYTLIFDYLRYWKRAIMRSPQTKRLILALLTLTGLFFVELSVGRFSHSLALLADAGHVASDAAALGISLGAILFSPRDRPNGSHPCRPQTRGELSAALINSCSLIAIALWIAIQATQRLHSGHAEILGMPLLMAAALGLGVNAVNAVWLHQCCHQSLNVKSAFLHVLADGMSSLGVLLGAIAISIWNCPWIDSVISLLVSGVILLVTLPLLSRCLQEAISQAFANADSSCACDAQEFEHLLFPTLERLVR